jgi:hypothetical protein
MDRLEDDRKKLSLNVKQEEREREREKERKGERDNLKVIK